MQLNRSQILMALVALLCLTSQSFAQSSLGIGASETQIVIDGPFASILAIINDYQQQFYRALTGALKDMRDDPSKLWLLVGMSFAYGVLHAAGPGHGKAVISSYMIANEIELKRGVVLSFLSALLQGISAIIVVGLVYFALRSSSVSMSDATHFLELASYTLIIMFGVWLLWKKLRAWQVRNTASHHSHSHHHNHSHDHDHDHTGSNDICSHCGHSHMPNPQSVSGQFSLKQAWSAILAVGIRPCSGAIIVLSFALLNGLYLGGILSVFAMAIGTAITVSTLATLAVTAKNTAVKFANSEHAAYRIGSSIEILGAVLVILLGILLLSAAL